MLVFAPFRASSGCESPSWRQPRQRKARSCRQEPAGENRDGEAPASPSPAAAEPGSRVAEHVIHGRKLEIKGEERARARCHPNLLPKVCKGGGNNPQTHTLAHPKAPAPLVSVQGDRTHGDALLHAPRLKQRQAKLNKKTPKPQEVHFYPSVFSPVGLTRVPCQSGRSSGCWEGSVRACTTGTAALYNSEKQLFPFLGGFFKPKKPAASCLGPRKARGRA